MKKKIMLKRITCSLVIAALMSTTVFAAEQPAAPQTATGSTTTAEQTVADETKNMLVSGTVTDITIDQDFTTITISNDQMGMVFHVNKNVFVIDQKTGASLSVADIKKDMMITAILDKMAPMTLSLPPQTGGAVGFIINSDQGFVDLSIYDDELVNAENSLKLNISTDTKIVDLSGTKKLFSAEDLKGSECLVLYGITTRSIPAQTSPTLVVILNSAATLSADQDASRSAAAAETEYVPLRVAAETKGYEVIWDPATKSITLTKDDIKAVLTVGSTAFEFTHSTKDIKPLDRMSALDLAVKLENGCTMVPSTFVEAL